MIFYGPEGAGKKTRVISFIQEVFGLTSLVLVEEIRSFKLENPNKNI
jgi:type IV secretory pathway ATPase VirB11/archaellum biosynthesis ATPase